MNLLFILPEYYPHPGGGIATYYLELLPELVRQGHHVRVIVGSGVVSGTEVLEKDGVAVEYLVPERFFKYRKRFTRFSVFPELQNHLAAAWAMWEQAGEGHGFDLVETADWGLGYAPWMVQAGGPPVVITLHASIGQIEFYEPRLGYELHGDLVRLLESELLNAAPVLISYSNSNKAEWERLIQNAVHYVPPAFGTRSREKTTTDGTARVVGRIQHWKGPEVLCQALEALGENFTGLEWIGRDTDYKGIVKSTSGYLQQQYPTVWNRRVKTTGALPYAEVQRRMARARFGIVPSVWDVFNYTCAEWMNWAKPVVCSLGAGASDLIDHGRNGFVFPAGDGQGLAEVLKEVDALAGAQLLAIGEAARETVAEKLNPAATADKRIQLYGGIRRHTPAKPLNPWVKAALAPASATADSIAETLNHLPLSVISKYTLNRTLQKFKLNA